jgi:ABC-type bacteriocin/lantibiotic exporter with double-glycine peptidase domain
VGCAKTTRKQGNKTKISDKIEEKIREYKEENVEENWKRIKKVIKEVADETVSKEGNQRNKKWFDEECAKVISEENNATKRNKKK